jgi:uncharacterized membrane protein
MPSQTYLTILRLLHISCGVLWAGGTIYLALFVTPAVKASGPDGAKFMQQLSRTNRLPTVMMIAAIINVTAGLLQLWELSGGFQSEWISSRHGIVLSTGGTLAIIAFVIGLVVTRPNVLKVAKLGQQIAAAGGPPTPEQMQLMMGYRKKIFSANNWVATLLAITVVIMSVVKYI